MKIAHMFRDTARLAEVGESKDPLSYLPHLTSPSQTEKASIDEAFFDFSIPAREEILRRYPYLSEPPVNSPLGSDTPLPPPPHIPFPPASTVAPSENPHAPKPEEGEEPSVPPPSIMTETWHDIALVMAAEMLQTVRDRVRTELGYTTSAVGGFAPRD